MLAGGDGVRGVDPGVTAVQEGPDAAAGYCEAAAGLRGSERPPPAYSVEKLGSLGQPPAQLSRQ